MAPSSRSAHVPRRAECRRGLSSIGKRLARSYRSRASRNLRGGLRSAPSRAPHSRGSSCLLVHSSLPIRLASSKNALARCGVLPLARRNIFGTAFRARKQGLPFEGSSSSGLSSLTLLAPNFVSSSRWMAATTTPVNEKMRRGTVSSVPWGGVCSASSSTRCSPIWMTSSTASLQLSLQTTRKRLSTIMLVHTPFHATKIVHRLIPTLHPTLNAPKRPVDLPDRHPQSQR